MHICVVGTGYVGLVTGACLADFGMDVTCVDKDRSKIDMLLERRDPDLRARSRHPGRQERQGGAPPLHHRARRTAIQRALAIFIAVGTPPKEDGSADLSYVIQVAESIADNLNGYKVVVTKSTVPIGTGQLIERIISRAHQRRATRSRWSPTPSSCARARPSRTSCAPTGWSSAPATPQAIAIMKDIYSPLYLIETPFVITNVESSELIKYASNAFLATKITFINEVAELCERLGADVHHVAKGMGLDKRIGPKFLHPGPGYGGSCFPKDTQALADIARQAGRPFEIVETVVAGQRADQAADGRQGPRRARRRRHRQDRRAARPVLQARDRRHARVAVDPSGRQPWSPRAPRCGPSTRWPWTTPAQVLPAGGGLLRRLLRRCRRRRRLVIVTEWNQFRSLDLERIQRATARSRSWSTCATSTSRGRCASRASSTTASAARRATCPEKRVTARWRARHRAGF